jgi:microcin C transport system substrate-binding protein
MTGLKLVPATFLATILTFVTGYAKEAGTAAPASSSAPLTADEQAVVDAFYREKPGMFTFATPEDLPKDLVWEDGSAEKPFADPRAIRGGTVTSFMLSWPPTLRFVGPDSNHSMRDVFLDYNKMSLASLHPVTKHWIPGLATAWAVSADKKTVYYRLDPDARYSDGVPVKAGDYFYTFYFNLSQFISAPWYNNWYGENYANITKYDDYTISVTLPEARPYPIYFTTLSPTPSHFYRVLDKDFLAKFQWKFEPTTGPWELLPQNVVQGNSLTVTHVKNWWAENKRFYAHRYNPEKRKFILIRDIGIAFESFKVGDLDMFSLTLPEFWYDRTQDLEAVKKGWIERAAYYNNVPAPTIGLFLNTANPVLADKRIRQGIHYACNWQRVIDFHYRGDFARLKGYVDGFGAYDSAVTARPFDPDKARALFAAAGFDKAGSDGVLVDGKGQRLSFALSVPQDPSVDECQILKEEALKAGLEINLDVQGPTTNYKKVMNKQHEIAFWGWGVAPDDPYPRFWETFHSVNANNPDGSLHLNTNNITATSDPQLDKLIEKYDRSTEVAEMIALAHQMEDILFDEASFIPGDKIPFYRLGYWGWIRFPEGFDVPLSEGPNQFGLYWIDPEAKKTILKARKTGADLGEKTGVFGEIPAAGNK